MLRHGRDSQSGSRDTNTYSKADCYCYTETERHCYAASNGHAYTSSNGDSQQHQHSLVRSDR